MDKIEPIDVQEPWSRVTVDAEAWWRIVLWVAAGNGVMLGLWSDGEAVHMAVARAPDFAPRVLSIACPDGRYPSVGLTHPPALRLERALRDLYGLVPVGLPDERPWLDHGRWGVTHPLGARVPSPDAPLAYAFRPAEGPPMHQIPVGPVHAGIIEPGHFRFTANGETVVRLEQRLGYVHKGIDGLMSGAPLERAAKLAGRVSGDSTVAYAIAFARAVEMASGAEAPARAVWLRAVMAELERIANHLGDIGAICNDASFSLLHAHFGALRERVLRAADACFGHRLMMDRVVPGGVAADLGSEGIGRLRGLLADLRAHLPPLVRIYDDTVSLQDRTVGTGVLTAELARQYGAGGFVGRASGRGFDARRSPGYAPYDQLAFDVPGRTEGDVNARVWLRIEEARQSFAIIEQLLARLPDGPVRAALPPSPEGAEGLSLVEGFRGDILAWVRLGPDGTVARCHLRDPSWFQWPLLEAAIEGNIVADFPLLNKSFNCSYSGHDL
ncbi:MULTISPECIES: NADH-quinone oxidoreductase subunit C [Rhodomicrobium]|uniref:hydrogenase large subunit n=1 Tax=Rhodomicrobium TaxID=1068 RepID=UPI000B4B59A6|nr:MULTISPECIES: NADH-quinone oxidoreductase subunit C [Rhodomicrobium]